MSSTGGTGDLVPLANVQGDHLANRGSYATTFGEVTDEHIRPDHI